MEKETRFWVDKTAVGKIFSFGVIVALVVGTVFVYQVLSSDITNRYPEYATLKAMGYSRGYLSWLVVQQAMLYAVLGYVPGLVLAFGLYWLAASSIGLPIGMTWDRAVVVLLLALAMCTFSGLLAMRKVQSADPADLF
jgi:putative ABC transport system permease protein